MWIIKEKETDQQFPQYFTLIFSRKKKSYRDNSLINLLKIKNMQR